MSVERFRKSSALRVLALSSIVTLFLAAPATAGVLTAGEHAIAGWYGTQAFSGLYLGVSPAYSYHANVDYAVYAPGDFGDSFPNMDPSLGVDYVYAYQIFNTGAGADQSLLQMTVGLDGDETVRNIGSFGEGLTPTNERFQPLTPPHSSAGWFFSAIPIGNPDPQSRILIYTSLAGPEWDKTTVQGAMVTSAERLLPSPGPTPTPEPTMLVLLVGAAVMFLGARLARR